MEALATLTGHAFGVLIPVTLAAICAAAMGFLAFSAWQSKLVHATGFKGDSTKDIKYAHNHPCVIACGSDCYVCSLYRASCFSTAGGKMKLPPGCRALHTNRQIGIKTTELLMFSSSSLGTYLCPQGLGSCPMLGIPCASSTRG